jgi:hypothetical protein
MGLEPSEIGTYLERIRSLLADEEETSGDGVTAHTEQTTPALDGWLDKIQAMLNEESSSVSSSDPLRKKKP